MSAAIYCRRSRCSMRMLDQVDAIGRLTYSCPACERNRAGFCRDCPAHLERPNAFRCPRCAREKRLEIQRGSGRRSYWKHRKTILRQKRRRQRDPEFKKYRREYLRRWRAAHPRERDALDRLYSREWARQRRQDPEYRERINALRRERDRQRRQEKAA